MKFTIPKTLKNHYGETVSVSPDGFITVSFIDGNEVNSITVKIISRVEDGENLVLDCEAPVRFDLYGKRKHQRVPAREIAQLNSLFNNLGKQPLNEQENAGVQDWQIKITTAGSSDELGTDCELLDISEGGALIWFKTGMPSLNSMLRVTVYCSGTSISTLSKVARIQKNSGCSGFLAGIIFVDIATEDQECLAELIDEQKNRLEE